MLEVNAGAAWQLERPPTLPLLPLTGRLAGTLSGLYKAIQLARSGRREYSEAILLFAAMADVSHDNLGNSV